MGELCVFCDGAGVYDDSTSCLRCGGTGMLDELEIDESIEIENDGVVEDEI